MDLEVNLLVLCDCVANCMNVRQITFEPMYENCGVGKAMSMSTVLSCWSHI